MRILLTNDDGIHGHGLTVLENIAKKLSDDIWIVAPETDQSGLAHSLTLSHPLRARKVRDKVWSVTGTPTDCVIMAARNLVEGDIDLVLSGVNAGQNTGDYVTYSGTVAGAMEGTLLGIPSISLSQEFSYDGKFNVSWKTAEDIAPELIKRLLKIELPKDTLLNINFPNCPTDEVKGEVITAQGKFEHGLHIDERKDNRGRAYYWLQFAGEPPKRQTGTDIDALRDNKVSISPIKLDLTNHEWIETLRQDFDGAA